MSSSLNQNQVFLITCREDVVLFCTDVFQKFATVLRGSGTFELPSDFCGAVVYDALDNSESVDFLRLLKKLKFPVFAIISPCLDKLIQEELMALSWCWIHSFRSTQAADDFKIRLGCFYGQSRLFGEPVEIRQGLVERLDLVLRYAQFLLFDQRYR